LNEKVGIPAQSCQRSGFLLEDLRKRLLKPHQITVDERSRECLLRPEVMVDAGLANPDTFGKIRIAEGSKPARALKLLCLGQQQLGSPSVSYGFGAAD
jgi:hypothetical protein